MLLGPVFRSELIRIGRRRVDFVLRVIYATLLLSIIGVAYLEAFIGLTTASVGRVSQFAQTTFTTFAIVQYVAVLILIPAFFGGAIVDEKQRKTLHYLMASGLSSGEIVFDKVLGRLPRIAVYLAIGLPVIALLGLFGGVDPVIVLATYGMTVSSMAFAVALATFVSTLARRVRSAVLAAYVYLVAWIIGPVLFYGVGSTLYPATYARIRPWFDWLWPISPFYTYIEWNRLTWGVGGLAGASGVLNEMVALQLGGAALLMIVSALLLRPTFRRQEGGTPKRRSFLGVRTRKPRKRWTAVPPCGDDAVAWRERHFAVPDRFTQTTVLPATILLTTFLILASGLDESLLRLASRPFNITPGAFVEQIRLVSLWYTAIWLMAVAGASASAVAIEREEDTWITLTSTPLTGRQIARGKAIGAIWAQRGFGAVLLGIWAVGLVSGALHPLSVLMTLGVLAMETWLVVAIGIHASIRSTTTSKALGRTLVTVAVLAGYPLFLLMSLSGYYLWDTPAAFTGLMARFVITPLVSWPQASEVWTAIRLHGQFPQFNSIHSYLFVWLLLLHLGVAAFLTWRVFGRFDAWLDRPRLTDQSKSGKTSVSI